MNNDSSKNDIFLTFDDDEWENPETKTKKSKLSKSVAKNVAFEPVEKNVNVAEDALLIKPATKLGTGKISPFQWLLISTMFLLFIGLCGFLVLILTGKIYLPFI